MHKLEPFNIKGSALSSFQLLSYRCLLKHVSFTAAFQPAHSSRCPRKHNTQLLSRMNQRSALLDVDMEEHTDEEAQRSTGVGPIAVVLDFYLMIRFLK